MFSEKYNKNFRLLDNSCKSFGVKVVDYLTNMRPCFFLRFSRKAIRSFFKELKALTNVKLVLYTLNDKIVHKKSNDNRFLIESINFRLLSENKIKVLSYWLLTKLTECHFSLEHCFCF